MRAQGKKPITKLKFRVTGMEPKYFDIFLFKIQNIVRRISKLLASLYNPLLKGDKQLGVARYYDPEY